MAIKKNKLDTMKILHTRNQNLMRELDKARQAEWDLQAMLEELKHENTRLKSVVNYQDSVIMKRGKK